MANLFQNSIYFLVLWIGIAFSAPSLAQEEKLFCPFDERAWKVGFQEYDEQYLVEMILKNEELLDWKELFTVQKFEELALSEKEFIQTLEKTSRQHLAEDQTLVFNELAHPSLNIFESSFILKSKDPSKKQNLFSDEYNIGRVLNSQTGLYYLRYSAKDAELFAKVKQEWIERLKQAYLAAEPKDNQQGHWLTFTTEGVYDGREKLPFQSHYQVIANLQAGFILSIPKDWLVDEQETQESDFDKKQPYTISLLFSDPGEHLYGGIAFYQRTAHANHSPIQPIKRYLHLYKKQSPQMRLEGKGHLQTVLGERGRYLFITDGEESGWIAFFEKNNKTYRMELWGPEQELEELKKNFEQLTANFQLVSSNDESK